jgi:hypothetical protein
VASEKKGDGDEAMALVQFIIMTAILAPALILKLSTIHSKFCCKGKMIKRSSGGRTNCGACPTLKSFAGSHVRIGESTKGTKQVLFCATPSHERDPGMLPNDTDGCT